MVTSIGKPKGHGYYTMTLVGAKGIKVVPLAFKGVAAKMKVVCGFLLGGLKAWCLRLRV